MTDSIPSSTSEVLSTYSDAQALTRLLQYCSTGASSGLDTAYTLLDRCGGLHQISHLGRPSVGAVPGLDPDSAEYIALIAELTCRYQRPQPLVRPKLATSEALAELLVHFFHRRRAETLYMLCLNPSWQLHAGGILSLGGTWQVRIPARRMLDLALRHNTRGVILVHNHPDGVTEFSDADIQSTWKMAHLLEQVQVSLLDHFLFVSGKPRSMRYQLEFQNGQSSPFSPMDRFPT